MPLKILYFAGLREAVGSGAESITMPAAVSTAAGLLDYLAQLDDAHGALLTTKNLRVAVNQKLVGMDAAVAEGDEVAFFPPVTGG